MADHVEDGTPHNPMYQWVCPQEGCRGLLMWLHGRGHSVCCACGATCAKNTGVLYDIGDDEPRKLSDDEVAELRG